MNSFPAKQGIDTAPAQRFVFDRVFFASTLAAGLLTLCCFAPLANAWWYRDDFWMLTLSRYVVDPRSFWTSDHSASFFYRPFGMTIWWLSTKLFATDPFAHYVINGILHWGVAVSFGAWMLLLAGSRWTGALATLLYVAHPVAMRTSQWLSDRFDLLATGFVFVVCALVLAPWTSRWRRVCLAAVAALACTSKETGFLVLPLVTAHWLSEPRESSVARARAGADALCVAIVVVAIAFGRAVALPAQGTSIMDAELLSMIPQGLMVFVSALPLALSGHFDATSQLGRAIPFMAVVVLLIAIAHARFDTVRDALSRRALALAAALIVSATLLHAPIAAANLYGSALLNDPVAARLFHASLAAGFLLLLAPCMGFVRVLRIHGGWWALLVSIIVGMMMMQSIAAARAWTVLTNSELRPLLTRAVKQIEQQRFPDKCRIVVHGPLARTREFQALSDVMVKALADDPAHQLLRCIVVAEGAAPTFTIIERDRCSIDALELFATPHLTAKPRPFANLCYQFLVLPYVHDNREASLDINIR